MAEPGGPSATGATPLHAGAPAPVPLHAPPSGHPGRGSSASRQPAPTSARHTPVVSYVAGSRVRSPLALALLLLTTLLLVAALVGRGGDAEPADHRAAPAPAPAPGDSAALTGATGTTRLPHRPPFRVGATPPIALKPGLPLGGQRIFAGHRFLVAYYGTAQTGAMGVLGRTDPATMQRRLMRAARPFREPGEVIQPLYELIATIADGSPGPDHDFSH